MAQHIGNGIDFSDGKRHLRSVRRNNLYRRVANSIDTFVFEYFLVCLLLAIVPPPQKAPPLRDLLNHSRFHYVVITHIGRHQTHSVAPITRLLNRLTKQLFYSIFADAYLIQQ